MSDVNNKGILVVSFGTLHQETCAKTIGAIEGFTVPGPASS